MLYLLFNAITLLYYTNSDEVNNDYVRDYVNTLDMHKELVKHVRALIYNGDVDMACNFLGDEWLTEMLNLPVSTIFVVPNKLFFINM